MKFKISLNVVREMKAKNEEEAINNFFTDYDLTREVTVKKIKKNKF